MELDALIAAEKQNDERIRQARAEADAIVAAAQRAAAEHDAALQQAIETLFCERAQALRVGHEQRVALSRREADAHVAQYRSVSATAIAGVIPTLLDLLLTDGHRP